MQSKKFFIGFIILDKLGISNSITKITFQVGIPNHAVNFTLTLWPGQTFLQMIYNFFPEFPLYTLFSGSSGRFAQIALERYVPLIAQKSKKLHWTSFCDFVRSIQKSIFFHGLFKLLLNLAEYIYPKEYGFIFPGVHM